MDSVRRLCNQLKTVIVISIAFLFCYKYACLGVSSRVFYDEINIFFPLVPFLFTYLFPFIPIPISHSLTPIGKHSEVFFPPK